MAATTNGMLDADEGTCRADPERQVETWKFDPSLRLSL